MANFEIPENPGYDNRIRMIETTDYGHASLLNGMYGRIIENCEHVKKQEEGLREDLDNLLDEDTIKLAQETGFLSGGGLTLLNSLLRLLLTNPIVSERDTGDWHVRERADGWTELTGTLGVDFPATVHSPSTGFHVRHATVPLPVALDTNRNRVAMAVDSSPGLHALNVGIHSSGDELKLTTGQPAENKGELPGYLTSIYVAGYKKA